MSTRPPRIVVFDLGGVVVRICRSFKEACDRAGLPRPPEHFSDEDLRAQRRALSDQYQTGAITCDEYFARVAAHTAGLYSDDDIRAVHRAWIIEEYPGVAELVGRLHDAGVHTACLSNTNHSHWQGMLDPEAAFYSPALAMLRTRLASQDLGLIKPDPAIYAEAARRLEASPQELIFFDDLEANVEAAREAGWRAHRIDHAGHPADQMTRLLQRAGTL